MRDKVDHDPSGGNIRWTVDLLFYVVVIVMLLNIIFGIVIDTFAQQRDLQKQIKDDIDNVCFVCGIDRNTFDRKHPVGSEQRNPNPNLNPNPNPNLNPNLNPNPNRPQP